MERKSAVEVHLKRYRLASDRLTQQALAEQVGVSRQTIISIERGKYKPSIELALRLARVFEVPVESLFELCDDEATSSVGTAGVEGDTQ